ncbi:ABC transporter substrate-binding protein [Frankia sp. AgB1.9]|uniref:ABC transporter substrate-binding protein n=1 Tax=unclassified Frankia TaxID=2632575 RepID=UPI0019338B08|nr:MULTISPECIES: ABC transporter substrate-binding protein [unclassified Frankia]MBL7493340.1 ABC transporter substrate-binding protein [Frankia sp. AgW1.1]MBL7549572.1 ABC transporter substrate-binding protein [Frankia sp. AgB1.9]MBL7620448.1 ABC transporter substrate-binding protein [Frankia sp. AgB1.8]
MLLRTPRILLGSAAALLLAVATSCASPGGVSAANGACDAPGVTPSQVKLGFVYPDSGSSGSTLSAARAGLDARIGLANEQGGVHGRKITYEWRDDEGQATVTALAAEDLVQQQKVFGLVTASASLGDAMDGLTRQNVPVAGIAIEPAWAGRQNMFSSIYGTSQVVVGQYLRTSHATRVAIVTGDASEVTSENTLAYERGLQAAGISAVEAVSFTPALGTPAHAVSKIMSFGADALLGITAPDDFAQVVQATRAAGAHLAVSVVLTGYDRSLLASEGRTLAGVSMPSYFRPFEAGGPAMERYQAAMARYAPEAGATDQQFAMFTYIDTDLFLRGLDLAGPCPTREGFIKALRGVSSYDADGLITPIDLRDYSGKPLNCNAFVQVAPDGSAFQVVRERVCADGSTG